ncbi:A/G-specific adenine glycosylase [Chitinimonas lacunae]|uniref:Adenine DNA glycosylase n=1 Tax=Chitinimonas lacunae TaxID=1963018 RepID=A0ABV8MNC8_9NEIS
MSDLSSFAERLVRWQRGHGRHDLPWQCRDPYRVWLSEIMLQQTQVTTVVPYYHRFIERFPTVTALAAAQVDQVLALWAGLGYYSRARNLHAAAQAVVERFGGQMPTAAAELESLPGIGRSTAAAIASFCFGERTAILDGNVKRVLTRWAGIEGFPGERAIEQRLWQLAESLLPLSAEEMPAYTQGMMDLGATICRRSRPDCQRCPLQRDCRAYAEGRTADLPTRKPKKTIPEKATVMLLVRDGSRLLLEKRPPSGIWGGLWSLPEMPPEDDPLDYCRERFGLQVATGSRLAPFVHVFTHYRLTITPQYCTVVGASSLREQALTWLEPAAALAAGIPTPVRRLLLDQGSPRLFEED